MDMGDFCSGRCVRILIRVARVNNLALHMHIASASHIGKEAAASKYCIDFAAMVSNGGILPSQASVHRHLHRSYSYTT